MMQVGVDTCTHTHPNTVTHIQPKPANTDSLRKANQLNFEPGGRVKCIELFWVMKNVTGWILACEGPAAFGSRIDEPVDIWHER